MSFTKLRPIAAGETGTHIAVPATVLELALPVVPLETAAGNMTRAGIHVGLAVAGTSKYVSGSYMPRSAS